jgi:predicted O-methyltransferase YrrM
VSPIECGLNAWAGEKWTGYAYRMAHKSYLAEPLQDYVLDNWLREPDVLRRLREETAKMPNSGMQIPPDQGQLMGVLAKLIGAVNYVEVGVFTGYSALAVALSLPDDGHVVACDVSEEFTSMGRRYWEEAGVARKIDLHIRPAVETLDWLLAEGYAGSFDMGFVDADKSNYANYYERILQLLRPNGVLLVDNVLWHGRLIDPSEQDADTVAIREINAALKSDERIDLAFIPIGDGVTVARKR